MKTGRYKGAPPPPPPPPHEEPPKQHKAPPKKTAPKKPAAKKDAAAPQAGKPPRREQASVPSRGSGRSGSGTKSNPYAHSRPVKKGKGSFRGPGR